MATKESSDDSQEDTFRSDTSEEEMQEIINKFGRLLEEGTYLKQCGDDQQHQNDNIEQDLDTCGGQEMTKLLIQ